MSAVFSGYFWSNLLYNISFPLFVALTFPLFKHWLNSLKKTKLLESFEVDG